MSVSKDAIRARDQEATDDYMSLPKRPRTEHTEREHTATAWKLRSPELPNMVQGDRESRTFQEIDKMHEERLPDPKFKCGQSVLFAQVWRKLKFAQETPETYSRWNYPVWFSADILSFKEYGTIRYAGQEVKDNLYNVYVCDGAYEVVPERFLREKPR